jgi:flotillin
MALAADRLPGLPLLIGLGLIALAGVVLCVRAYRKCPPGRLLVVYGAHLGDWPAVVLKEGGRFVLPIVQGHSFLSLEPIAVHDVQGTPTTVRIGTDPQRMQHAAIHLIGLPRDQIASMAERILEEHGFPANRADAVKGLEAIGLELL